MMNFVIRITIISWCTENYLSLVYDQFSTYNCLYNIRANYISPLMIMATKAFSKQ